MSCYRCDICEELKDADFHGCNENPKDEYGCICDSCEERIEVNDNDRLCAIEERNRK